MTPRIFISYSSKDSDIAEFIHEELTKRGADVFIDYRGLDEGDDFHERLAGEIKSRDRVLFLLSRNSIVSNWVRVELKFAFKHYKPIVPLALDDAEIPDALFFVDLIHRRAFTRTQEDITRLCKVLGVTDANPSRPATVDPSPDPSPNSERGASKSAPSSPDPFSHASGEKGDSVPEPLTPPPSPPRIQGGAQTDHPNRVEPAVVGNSVPTPAPSIKRLSSLELMPQPFAWIDIPGTIGKKWKGEPYKIAKYPVTNAQYKVFVEAGGYDQPKWWTQSGWQYRQDGKWTNPAYWHDEKWNGADYPVVGVSWFEAIAFCLWLSDVTGEKIMLPSDDQWQYAVQGDDGREYPWGNQFDAKRCNTRESKIGKTTPVRQYEGTGDSPFGVVDMAGNVSEWCATDYSSKSNDIHINATYRVLRGGSWVSDQDLARAAYRLNNYPDNRLLNIGFRVGVS